MAAFFPALSEAHQTFIQQQHMFFVGTAAESGEVNLSPKGMESLKVISGKQILWLNLTGSGNESAAHLKLKNRMTLMWCSFGAKPLILRVYATANTIHPNSPRWPTLLSHFPPSPGARQIFELDIHKVQTSCGFAVPHFEFVADRPTLTDHWQKKGEATLPDYWSKKNSQSIDGFDSGMTDVVNELEATP